MPAKKTPSQYDVTSYLGRSQYVNSTIDANTAKKRQNSFKNLAGPVSGAAMLGATIVGGLAGAPFSLLAAPIAGLSYVADMGKKRAERKAKNKKNSAAAVKRTLPKRSPVSPVRTRMTGR